jgi:hypothetical protein
LSIETVGDAVVRLETERDAALARVAELTEQRDSGRDHAGRMMAERDAANARADEAERERTVFDDQAQELSRTLDRVIEERGEQFARAEAAELTARNTAASNAGLVHACQHAESESAALRAKVELLEGLVAGVRLRADSDTAALRAEMDRLRAELDHERRREVVALVPQLAAANALLKEVPLSALSYAWLTRGATVAAQPATAPTAEFQRGVEWARGNPDVGWPGR